MNGAGAAMAIEKLEKRVEALEVSNAFLTAKLEMTGETRPKKNDDPIKINTISRLGPYVLVQPGKWGMVFAGSYDSAAEAVAASRSTPKGMTPEDPPCQNPKGYAILEVAQLTEDDVSTYVPPESLLANLMAFQSFGKISRKRLKQLGLRTVADLSNLSVEELKDEAKSKEIPPGTIHKILRAAKEIGIDMPRTINRTD